MKIVERERQKMTFKFLEIRDSATFIPALAIQISREDGYLPARAGFGDPCIYLIHLTSHTCAYDPYDWPNRTMVRAHEHISDCWSSLKDGDVVDVQFINGETTAPKQSEQFEG